MDASGDSIIPTLSTLTLFENCGSIHIQVVADYPDTMTMHKEGFGSRRPHLRVKSPSSNWIDSLEQFTMTVVDVSTFSSIQIALDSSPVGSRVLLTKGHYFENLNIIKPVTLVGNGSLGEIKLFGHIQISSHDVTIDGLSIYPLEVSEPVFEIFSSISVFIQNCRIIKDRYSRYNLHLKKVSSIQVVNSSSVHLINNHISDYGIGLNLKNCTSCIIQTNYIKTCWTALKITRCQDMRLVGNHFQENALVLLSDADREDIGKNTFEGNLNLTINNEMSNIEEPTHNSLNKTSTKQHLPRELSRIIITGTCFGDWNEAEESDLCVFLQGITLWRTKIDNNRHVI